MLKPSLMFERKNVDHQLGLLVGLSFNTFHEDSSCVLHALELCTEATIAFCYIVQN